MKYEINVQIDEQFMAEIDESTLIAAVRATLHQQDIPTAALTVVVTDDAAVN